MVGIGIRKYYKYNCGIGERDNYLAHITRASIGRGVGKVENSVHALCLF